MTEDPIERLRRDPDLGAVVEAVGPVSIDPAEDPFRRLVVSLCRQQLSMAAAEAIEERLFDAVTITPAGVLSADEATLRETGLSASKVEYLRALATAFEETSYDREYFDGWSDDEVVDELTEIRGVGPWTAEMFLMFGLGREDVFPVGDLGIRKGMWQYVDEDLSRAEMREHAERWGPHRSYASLYLWRGVENDL